LIMWTTHGLLFDVPPGVSLRSTVSSLERPLHRP
jgi:hypothetical protein